MNFEGREQERESIYLKATSDILNELNHKSEGGKSKKEDGEPFLENLGVLLKRKLNQKDVGDIIVLKTQNYINFLREKFIPDRYEEIYKNAQSFFTVLENSDFITAQDSSDLFDLVIQSRNKKLAPDLMKKKLKIRASSMDFDILDETLTEVFFEEQQKIQKNKEGLERIWEEFSRFFNMIDFPGMELHNVHLVRYGSSQNMFQTASSDFDVTLLTDCYVDERALLKVIKEYFDEFIKNGDFEGEVKKLDTATVRIPHVAFIYKGCDFDLTINNVLGVVNTKLLDVYASIDERCHKLGVLVKLWAKVNDLCSGYDCLSSYAYVLMVINFLQILGQPILPCLQKMATQQEIVEVKRLLENQIEDVQNTNIAFEKDLVEIEKRFLHYRKNSLSLSQLFILFFEWYSRLAETNDEMISVKNGCLLPRKEKLDYQDQMRNPKTYVFSIEDPFDETHDPGRNFKTYNTKNKGSKELNPKFVKFKEDVDSTRKCLQEFTAGKRLGQDVKKLFKKKES